MIFAQNIGEYGMLSGIADAFVSVANRVEVAFQEPRTAIPLIGVALVAAYLLFRRR